MGCALLPGRTSRGAIGHSGGVGGAVAARRRRSVHLLTLRTEDGRDAGDCIFFFGLLALFSGLRFPWLDSCLELLLATPFAVLMRGRGTDVLYTPFSQSCPGSPVTDGGSLPMGPCECEPPHALTRLSS